MPPIIEVRSVSKKYSRNATSHLGYGLRDLWGELAGRRKSMELRQDEFFAVHDVSFNLEAGDSFALIGRNGSGKTTLLKMMNGLIKPDAGEILLRGRVQALINLGAGFSPNLSGRDNIFNSAALVGLSYKDTALILEEIIDFAELDTFIDSPVGTYSSGMKARLGFAVAVHLNPEILLIDEVLAVGDFAFRNKCFTRLEQLKAKGATIVFVSHSESQVVKLCKQALWIDRGIARQKGPARDVVRAYLNHVDIPQATTAKEKALANNRGDLYGPELKKDEEVDEVQCQIIVDGQATDSLRIHSAVEFRVSFRLKTQVSHLYSTLNFHRKDGLHVAAIASMQDDRFFGVRDGHVEYSVLVDDFAFVPGEYVIMMPIADGQKYLWRSVVKEFVVEGDAGPYFAIVDMVHSYSVSVVKDY